MTRGTGKIEFTCVGHPIERFGPCCAHDFVGRYSDAIDEGRWDEIAGFFASDAVFDATAFNGRVLAGRDEIRQFYVDAPRAVGHHGTGPYIVRHEASAVTVRMKMLVVFRRSISSITYEWGFRFDTDTWRIHEQHIAIRSTRSE